MSMVQSLPDFQLLNYDNDQNVPLLTVRLTASWTHCGPLLPDEYNDLPYSFHAWAKASVCGDLANPLTRLLRYINTFFSDAGIETYWLTIRATRGSHDYDIPRWHTDDEFFRFPGNTQEYPRSEAQWKLAATLLGPGTLFVEDSSVARSVQRETRALCEQEAVPHSCTSIRCLGCADVAESTRKRLAKALASNSIVQAPARGCIFFRVGPNQGAVHSEPASHSDRIFVNCIPGTKKELTLVMKQWGMEYPRSWSIGVPLQFDSGTSS
ncbi:hypothetical protein EJ05DRAFT_505723 [Pseudovirgaria hyperparasitica]|uniref:Uncharacterized protein n=1 Tax=Pseudovirgaria hyperparasitica TaxID=470096 RepID=A0A6A6VU30_9PEZI|nr:uncharacterized protein EJ05DRAFT_505723 [Pseudovirgaria hyperparasitica]KAF2752751.1 hypothetical protein EJ05DRAFT_505723 [Pseudovirgaria hyperparasitica]